MGAADLVKGLKAVFGGFAFLPPSHAVDGELSVSYTDLPESFLRFGSDPINLKTTDQTPVEPLLQKVRVLYPVDDHEDLYRIGFMNGMLVYRNQSGMGHCHLFRTDRESPFLVGSLHKLLFVFLCLLMAERQRFLVHCAAVRHGQKGYLFWGPSGAGKTTISGFSERHDVFSDDAPVLLRDGDSYYCMSSPFHQLGVQDGVPAADERAAVEMNLFPHKADAVRLVEKKSSFALSAILSGCLHGFELMDRELKKKAFDFIYDYCRMMPAYDLYFPKNPDFWKIVVRK